MENYYNTYFKQYLHGLFNTADLADSGIHLFVVAEKY